MKIYKIFPQKMINNAKGFSLIEVLLGITIFMIGMLGVTALNISSLKSNTFSGNMTEAVIIAGDRLEQLMAMEFEDPCITDPDPGCVVDPNYPLNDIDGDGTDQDDNEDGRDDDDPGDAAADIDGKLNFGLDDTECPSSPLTIVEADGCDTNIGKNSMFTVYWNVAVGEPLPEKTKTVNVIVEWYMKDVKRTMNMSTIITDY